MTSTNFSGVTPWVIPNVRASAIAAMCTPASNWFTAFIALPAPTSSPKANTVSEILFNTGCTAEKASGVPDAIIDSFPKDAFIDPPEIGASR